MKTNPTLNVKQVILFISLLLSIQLFAQPIIVSGSSENDVIGRTCRMTNGNLITVIERNPDWGSGDLYATISSNDGETWGFITPVVVDAGNQSTFSLVVSPNDSLILFYASNENGFYKIYSISSFDGISWYNKQQIDLGWNINQQIYGPMVIVEEDNSFTMVYIGLGGGAYIAHCPNGGIWDVDKTMIQSGAYRARICKNNDTYLIAYHRNIGGNYDIHVKSSIDRINWTPETDITSNGNSHDAFCNTTPNGKYILYYAKNYPSNYNICKKESEDGVNWSDEESITMDAVNNTQPSFFVEESTIYLTWTHAIDYDTNNDIYLEKFDYITAIENHDNQAENLNPRIFYSTYNNCITIENLNPNEKANIVISDLSGSIYYSESLTVKNRVVIDDLTYLKKGIYICSIYTYNQKYSKKFVISD